MFKGKVVREVVREVISRGKGGGGKKRLRVFPQGGGRDYAMVKAFQFDFQTWRYIWVLFDVVPRVFSPRPPLRRKTLQILISTWKTNEGDPTKRVDR